MKPKCQCGFPWKDHSHKGHQLCEKPGANCHGYRMAPAARTAGTDSSTTPRGSRATSSRQGIAIPGIADARVRASKDPDTERLDWLEEHGADVWGACQTNLTCVAWTRLGTEKEFSSVVAKGLRAAIDLARKRRDHEARG